MKLQNLKTGEIKSHNELAELYGNCATSVLNAVRLTGNYKKDWVCIEKVHTKPNRKRKIICLETGQIWESIRDCAKDMDSQPNYFNTHLRFKYPKTIKGKTFEYYEEV